MTKIYEAVGAVADNRIVFEDGEIRCYSSSRKKYYIILYDDKTSAIMTNDNGTYWQDYLGYPAIAFLLKKEILPYDEKLAFLMKGIKWKDVNQKFNNNFDLALNFILEDLEKEKRIKIDSYVLELYKSLEQLKFKKLGKKIKPPAGY